MPRGGFGAGAGGGSLDGCGGRGDRKPRHDGSAVVPDARADAAHAELGLLVVHGVAVAADALELLFERAHGGKGVAGVLRPAGPLGGEPPGLPPPPRRQNTSAPPRSPTPPPPPHTSPPPSPTP